MANPSYLGKSDPHPWPYVRSAADRDTKNKIIKSLKESLTGESDSFAEYLATKIMREFNVSTK